MATREGKNHGQRKIDGRPDAKGNGFCVGAEYMGIRLPTV